MSEAQKAITSESLVGGGARQAEQGRGRLFPAGGVRVPKIRNANEHYALLTDVERTESRPSLAKYQEPTGTLPALKVPDPEFLIERLRAHKPAAILSRVPRMSRAGQAQLLVNELGPSVKDAAYVWGVIQLEAPTRHSAYSHLAEQERAGLDEFTRREFAAEKDIYLLPLKLVEAFDPPLKLKRPPRGRRFASVVDLDTDVAKAHRGAFIRFGGSSVYADRIFPLFSEHKTYVEPFAGGAHVLFSKPRSEKEVLADFDSEVVHALTTIRDDAKLPEKLGKFDRCVSKEGTRQAREEIPEDPVARVHRFLYLMGATFRGSYMGTASHEFAYDPAKLVAPHKRLQGVVIECASYQQTLAKHDGPDSFFFLDPPYPGEWRTYYDEAGGYALDWDDFAGRVKKLSGNWLLVLGDLKEHKRQIEMVGGHRFRLQVMETKPGERGRARENQEGWRRFATSYPIRKSSDIAQIISEASLLSKELVAELPSIMHELAVKLEPSYEAVALMRELSPAFRAAQEELAAISLPHSASSISEGSFAARAGELAKLLRVTIPRVAQVSFAKAAVLEDAAECLERLTLLTRGKPE